MIQHLQISNSKLNTSKHLVF